MPKKALLIIDVQKSTVSSPKIAERIEQLQNEYKTIFVSQFVNKGSPVTKVTGWEGLSDTDLSFKPLPRAHVFQKNVFSSYIPALDEFDEIHLCGFDTDACVLKTAMDLIEHGIKPVVLASYCGSESDDYHREALHLLRRNIGMENVRI